MDNVDMMSGFGVFCSGFLVGVVMGALLMAGIVFRYTLKLLDVGKE